MNKLEIAQNKINYLNNRLTRLKKSKDRALAYKTLIIAKYKANPNLIVKMDLINSTETFAYLSREVKKEKYNLSKAKKELEHIEEELTQVGLS